MPDDVILEDVESRVDKAGRRRRGGRTHHCRRARGRGRAPAGPRDGGASRWPIGPWWRPGGGVRRRRFRTARPIHPPGRRRSGPSRPGRTPPSPRTATSPQPRRRPPTSAERRPVERGLTRPGSPSNPRTGEPAHQHGGRRGREPGGAQQIAQADGPDHLRARSPGWAHRSRHRDQPRSLVPPGTPRALHASAPSRAATATLGHRLGVGRRRSDARRGPRTASGPPEKCGRAGPPRAADATADDSPDT